MTSTFDHNILLLCLWMILVSVPSSITAFTPNINYTFKLKQRPNTYTHFEKSTRRTEVSNRNLLLKMTKNTKSRVSRRGGNENNPQSLEELSRTMDLSIPELVKLLEIQRDKANIDDKKTKLINKMLKEAFIEEKKTDDDYNDPSPISTNAQSTISSEKRKKRANRRPKRPATLESSTITTAAPADPSVLTSTAFSSIPNLHPASKRAISDVLGLTHMTEIQSKTFSEASHGIDVLGRARTGTGKTLAFLLPLVEVLLRETDDKFIGALIVSPTRELAIQIGTQAEAVLKYHPRLTCHVMYGGTKMTRDTNRLKKGIPSILVATPGRLLDHLTETKVEGGRRFADVVSRVKVLVLDETDRLLDMGFRRDILKIISYVPKKRRQTLLFSATVPNDLKQIIKEVMQPNFVTVDCISDKDLGTHTSAKVDQSHVILPSMDVYVSHVMKVVDEAMKEGGDTCKIVAFFPAAKIVAFFAKLFNDGIGINVIEIHSKKSQSYRNRSSEAFRNAKSGILFTSDVSARGVDYPDVTHVLQFGIPDSKEQYIHRLGRTGRAGKQGKGWLILAPFEKSFLTELTGHDVPVNQELSKIVGENISSPYDENLHSTLMRITNGEKEFIIAATQAYQAFLGFYKGQMKRMRMRSSETLVSYANEFAGLMGLSEVPALSKNLVSKMGLKGVDGIVVEGSSSQPKNRSRRN